MSLSKTRHDFLAPGYNGTVLNITQLLNIYMLNNHDFLATVYNGTVLNTTQLLTTMIFLLSHKAQF